MVGVLGCERKRTLDSVIWDVKGARNVCKVQEGHHALKIHTGLLWPWLEEVGLIWMECNCWFWYLVISIPPLTERKVRRGWYLNWLTIYLLSLLGKNWSFNVRVNGFVSWHFWINGKGRVLCAQGNSVLPRQWHQLPCCAVRFNMSEKGDSVPLYSPPDFFMKQLSVSVLGCLKKELPAGSCIMQRSCAAQVMSKLKQCLDWVPEFVMLLL